MKKTQEIFKVIHESAIFPADLTWMIAEYSSLYNVKLAKEIYQKISKGYGYDRFNSELLFGFNALCQSRSDLAFIMIFTFTLYALQAEEEFNCTLWHETRQYLRDLTKIVDADPLKMLRRISVDYFYGRNLISYIISLEPKYKHTPAYTKFKYAVYSFLSLKLAVVSINPALIDLMSKMNSEGGYTLEIKSTEKTINYYLESKPESKISCSKTRYIGLFGNDHVFVLTYKESIKLKGVCDLYCESFPNTTNMPTIKDYQFSF